MSYWAIIGQQFAKILLGLFIYKNNYDYWILIGFIIVIIINIYNLIKMIILIFSGISTLI